MNLFSRYATAAFGIIALTACGGSGNSLSTNPQPLLKVNGVLNNPQSIPVNGSTFRITALWVGVDGGQKTGLAVDLGTAGTSFPSQFTLGFVSLPPVDFKQAFTIGGTTFHAYAAEIGAYEDGNGNKQLDFDSQGNMIDGDRLLGVATGLRVMYLEDANELAAVQGLFPGAQLGFNLLQANCVGGCGDQSHIIPLDSVIRIDLTPDAKWE